MRTERVPLATGGAVPYSRVAVEVHRGGDERSVTRYRKTCYVRPLSPLPGSDHRHDDRRTVATSGVERTQPAVVEGRQGPAHVAVELNRRYGQLRPFELSERLAISPRDEKGPRTTGHCQDLGRRVKGQRRQGRVSG